MLELALPWALALLPAPLLIRALAPAHRVRVPALRIPFFDSVVDAAGADAGEGSIVLGRARGERILGGLLWAVLVLGLARPEMLGEPVVRTEASRDVLLAIDLSGSMAYRDFPSADGEAASRLDAVQRVVDAFVAERTEDRIGLIVFGDRAYVQLPFTRDLESARALVALMDVGMAGPRTALGDAIGLSIHAFEDSDVDERLLILLTDGNDTASRMTPVNAAEIAARNGITLYTIGIGDEEATGEDRVDFTLLADIAERTGGRFYSATDEATLRSIYARIDAQATAERRTSSWRPRESLVWWCAGAVVILGLIGFALRLLRARRSRRPG